MEGNSESRPMQRMSDTIQSDVAMFRSTATDLERQVQRFIDERPVTAVLSALGIGFIVARIFSRR